MDMQEIVDEFPRSVIIDFENKTFTVIWDGRLKLFSGKFFWDFMGIIKHLAEQDDR